MDTLIHFLVVFNRETSQLISQESFTNEEKAIAEYSKAERANLGNEELEVVLLSADSIETLEQTHNHNFSGKNEKTDYSKLLEV